MGYECDVCGEWIDDEGDDHACDAWPDVAEQPDPEYAAAMARLDEAERIHREAESVERQRELEHERKVFGQKCKRMMDLLSVNKLPASFEDAKRWVRIFEEEDDPTTPAATWIDGGWTDPELVGYARLECASPAQADEALRAVGLTRESLPDDYSLLEALEDGNRALAAK